MKIVEKVQSLEGGREMCKNLTECSLFICNKWDLVPEKEREAVKEHVVQQLGKCWQDTNVRNHILYMSIQNAIKVQEYGSLRADPISQRKKGLRNFDGKLATPVS